MESFIQKVLTLPLNYIIVALIAFFYILENFQKTSFRFTNRLNHLLNNVLFYLSLIAVSYVVALFQVYSIQWISDHQVGLFNQVHIPITAKVIIGIACYDFTIYWVHRFSHKSSLLWRLHRVHHSDTNFDASTFFRHHPLEVIVTASSSIIASAIFGLDTIILSIYVFLLIPYMIVQHSNVRFPAAIDRVLGKLLVTPNFHKLHHAQDQFYTDSNFADIFIIWDRLFGTYKSYPANQIVYGLKEFDEEKRQSFWFLIKSPFMKIDKQ